MEMQPFQILHLFIFSWLATTLIEAQDYSKPGCRKYCGDVEIGYPFGIGRNCSKNEWFAIDCKSSTPYLSALNNLQVLHTRSQYSNQFIVNMPVIYKVDCKNSIKNTNIHLLSTTHRKSPFRFSGSGNILVFEGCGGASIMGEKGSIITGCSTTCGNDTISDINNCFGVGCCQATIPHDLESFTLNVTGFEKQDGDETCGYAFLIYAEYPYGFNVKDHSFIPILLSWGCDDRCGEISITDPFGIGIKCSRNEWYNINCNSSTPYLSALNNVQVLDIRPTTITVNMPVIKGDCNNPIQNSNLVMNTTHGKSPFRISASDNKLVFKGCGDAAIMEENGTIVTRCSTTCGNDTVSNINNCFGIGCCQTTMPYDLRSFTLNVTGLERQPGNGSCSGSAFLVDAKHYSTESDVNDHSFSPISLSWGCKDKCGEVLIPYPFGIGSTCSQDKWFSVDCKSSKPYLSAFNNLEVLGVDSEKDSLTVNVSMISDCENPIQNSSLVLSTESPFVFSIYQNVFVVEGCGNAAIMDENGNIATGCSTSCRNDTVSDINSCFGVGCCQANLPSYSTRYRSFTFNLTGLKRQTKNGSCAGSAFLVDRISFNKGRFSRQFFPITLVWGYGPDVKVSEECKRCENRGGYCYRDSCLLYGGNKKAVILGVSISMGLLFLMVVSYALYKIIKKTKAKRRKQRFFKRNGGILLKQQQETDIGFTSSELEKATDYFNENRILGRGGQGTVYKGMLVDGRIVAIKKSKVIDESQLEQFINEVVILSQVNHRNVVKLLGCCLETEVPLLVSEFIPNGTLYDLIQDETGEFSFPLNIRLQIAAEVSGAVSYLHSATSIPIYHRDIKTTNILLDEKYRAKVSDFGTSRFVSMDQTHLTTLVKGTFGYLDPEYFQSSQFTEKSDVYSFGVVLLELLTREKPISLTRFGENRSLATHFLLAMEEGRVMSIFDAIVVKEGSRTELMALANLAMRCLNFSGKNRPTMKEVSIELEGIRFSHVPSTVQTNFRHVKQCDEVLLKYGASASTSMTFDDNHSQ